MPDLFLALDHRVNEAASSIGMLCAAAECEKLATRVGKIPFDVISAGVEQALFRSDVPDDTKIKLIGRIRELGTQEANKFLRDTVKKWPAKGSARDEASARSSRAGDGRWLMKRLAILAAVVAACGGGQTHPNLFSTDWERRRRRVRHRSSCRSIGGNVKAAVGADVAVGVGGNSDKLVGIPLAGGTAWTFAHAIDVRPTIAGSVVVAEGGGELFALDAASGKKLWARQVGPMNDARRRRRRKDHGRLARPKPAGPAA